MGCEAKQHCGVKKIMMTNIGHVAGELAQGLFCRLPTKAGDLVRDVMNPKALQNTLELAKDQGLDLSGVHLHLPDILEGHGDVLALNKPILSDTVFSGSNGVDYHRLGQTLKLVNPTGESAVFRDIADNRPIFNGNTSPGVTISGGSLGEVQFRNVRGAELDGLSAKSVIAEDTTGLTITPQHHTGKQLPSQIKHLTLEHSDAHVQGGFDRPTVASVDIKPPARFYHNPQTSLTVSEGNAVGEITFHPSAKGSVDAKGSSTPVGPIEIKPGANASLSGNLGPVTANDAADLHIYPTSLESLHSKNSPTGITAWGSHNTDRINLGAIRITDSPNVTLSLNNAGLTDGLHVNGGQTGYVSLQGVTSEKPITFRNSALQPMNSDSTLSVIGSKAPEINLEGLSSKEQGRRPTVHLEGNNTPLTTVTGNGIDLKITNPNGLDGSPDSIHNLSLRDSGIALKTSPGLRPTFNFDGSNGTTIGLVPDRGVNDQVTFPNLTIKGSDGIEVWSPEGVGVGNLDVRYSKVKLRLDGPANTVNLTKTELDRNSFLSPTHFTATNPQGNSGLRLLDPNTIFKSITNEGIIPQVKTGSATIVDARPFGPLEIAGSGHQVAINNSRVPGARLEGGTGPNVTLSDSNFSGARVVQTQAEIGKPISYPHLEGEGSTIQGLREEGPGIKTKFRNLVYGIQDAWGSLFGGDRRSV